MKKILIIIGALLLLAIRMPGLSAPFYQDEWKNVSASESVSAAGSFFAHPPLMQMIFVADHAMFGEGGFRILPLIFFAASVGLLYLVVRRRFGESAALWSSAIYASSFYGILGSLQPDVDGSVLPFFFLLAVYAYERFSEPNLVHPSPNKSLWLTLLVFSLLLGLLTKLSFVLVVGVIILDYLWAHRQEGWGKNIGAIIAVGASFVGAYIGLLFLIQYIYPAFSIHFMLTHANQFAAAGGRNWTQIAVQGIKALYYLSPLVIAPLFLITRDTLRKTRIFWLYLVLGFIFYFVLLDFSQGALDKYLMFALAPLAVISGIILSGIFAANTTAPATEPTPKRYNVYVITLIGLIISAGLLALNWLPQTVAALYPKTEWFGRVLHGHWNVLTPITGGSGPMGFYVSFLFIAASFIVCIAHALAARYKKSWLVPVAIFIVVSGIVYNGVFAEEYMFGALNGSSAKVLSEAVAFIAKDPQITQVITYNDIGAHDLAKIGKYAGRFYAAPQFEAGHEEKFAAFKGDYMVIEIPHIYEDSFYGRFFQACKPEWTGQSGRVNGTVYSCTK